LKDVMLNLNQGSPKSLVMVVDDEEGVRKLARRALELAGFRVIEARDGLEALALIDDAAPVDLLCADMNMPSLAGDEMARRFRLRQPDLKVLYVSGFVDSLFEKRHTLWQGEAFLEKPFTAKGLVQAVSLLLSGRTDPSRSEAPA
jgi:two-component system cell cycle sensor histidine kinase/response regulator CckA